MKTPIAFFALFLVCLLACEEKPAETNVPPSAQPAPLLSGNIIDLTHAFSDETVYWVTAEEFELEEVAKGQTDQGYYYAANNFSSAEHGGTHIDAPIHFAEGRQTVDEVPLEQLMGEAVKIDLSLKAKEQPDYLISIEDLTQWESEHGLIPGESLVLLQTGFGTFYPDKERYLGTEERGPEAVKELHFPGLAPDAALWLVEERNIKAVGIDTPSIDYGQSTDFGAHVALMTHNVPAFENVANMEQLPATGFQLIALPMKIKGGSGAPLRIIAIVP